MRPDFGIVNKIDPAPAIYVYKPHPENFKSTKAKDKYKAEWERRYIEGDFGLTGPHLFFLQECMVKTTTGGIIRPWWRDCDSMIFESWEDAKKRKDDLFVFKRRRLALSTFGGEVLPIHTALFNPGSNSLITSADKDRLKGMFRDKLMVGLNNLHPHVKPSVSRMRQEGYLFLATEEHEKGMGKKIGGLQSSILSKESVRNPNTFEGDGAIYGFFDEIFLHPKAGIVRGSMSSCFMEEGKKVASMLIGGSVGISKSKGVEEGTKLWKESIDRQILTLFIGGVWGLKDFSINGWSDTKAAEEYILKSREEKFKADDKTDYFQFLVDYPLSAEEGLNLTTDSIWSSDILITLDQADKKIERNNIVQKHYYLHREGTGDNVVAVPAPEGVETPFVIANLPKQGFLYTSGTDPIDFSNNKIADGSDFANIINNNQTGVDDAYYKERIMDADVAFRNSAMLQDLFNKAKTMIELNKGGAIFNKYLQYHREDLLAPTPFYVGIDRGKRDYPWGYFKNTQIDPLLNSYLLDFIYKQGYNIELKLLIEQIRKFGTTNTDLADAKLAQLLYRADLQEQNKMMQTVSTPVRRNTIVWKNGRREREVVEEDYNKPLTRRRR